MRFGTIPCAAIAAAVGFGWCSGAPALAGGGDDPIIEWEKRIDAEGRLQSFGLDLLGDQIDPASGSIVFEHTDVAIPGNSSLDVSIRRRRSQGTYFDWTDKEEFGDWSIEVPRIQAIKAGINQTEGTWSGNRCSNDFQTSFPSVYYTAQVAFTRSDYSEGVVIETPGGGSRQLLEVPQGAQWSGGPGGTAKYVTVDNWRVTCITASDGGEGFLAVAPNGDTYRFDRFILRQTSDIGTAGGTGSVRRYRNILAATQVTDVSGNWVQYHYDSAGRLDYIDSNDGRYIDVVYNAAATGGANLIYQVKANQAGSGTSQRIWTYSYGAGTYYVPSEFDNQIPHQAAVLRTVTLPDGTAWSFTLDEMASSPGPGMGSLSSGSQPPGGICKHGAVQISLSHPNGAQGTFTLAEIANRQSLIQSVRFAKACPFTDLTPSGSNIPTYVEASMKTMAVKNKTITSPNASPSSWSFFYEEDKGDGPEGTQGTLDYHTNATNVYEPGGRKLTYYHYWSGERGFDQTTIPWTPLPAGSPFGGKLAGIEIYDTNNGGALLERTEYSYFQEDKLGAPVAAPRFSPYSSHYPVRAYETTITRGSDDFNTRNIYNSDFASATYSFGSPIEVEEWGNTAGGYSQRRETATSYVHNKTKWVLGLPNTVTRNGKLFDDYNYDTLGRVSTKYMFGALRQTFTYSTASGQQGTVATFKDSHNHTYTLSNWKRGKPQSVARPNSLGTFTRVVDDNGWVTSETDWKGNTTAFGYNTIGWLTSINPPGTFFNTTTIGYSSLATGVVETRTRGAKKVTITYDGYLRPTLVKTEATDGSAATNYVKTQYDGLGRTILQTWPSASSSPIDGIETTYDALSRPLTVRENVSPLATTTTEYLSGGVTRVTDPANAVITTTARAFGNPNEVEPTKIVDAMSATTDLTRNIWGNVTQLDQYGNYNGLNVAVQRKFWFDNELRLCRHKAPEFGEEIFLYDTEGLLIESGRGAAPGTTCPSTISSTIKVAHVYNPIHLETSVDFPTGTPDVSRTYDLNGNLASAARVGGTAWTYQYNELDQITQEWLGVGENGYQFNYTYTANGDLNSRSNNHSGLTIDFNANAYGQPRRARVGAIDYISSAIYHENGLPESATYLNGQLFSQTLNNRQLPDQLKTSKPGGATAVWHTYAYDIRRKVDAITDGVSSVENRDYGYDANGRLVSAAGPWGAGSYVYDALGNLRSWTQGSKTGTPLYGDATNRVTAYAKTGAATRNFTYDARGNTTDNDDNSFTYDFANQPVSVGGAIPATHEYDGNFKRVKTVENGKTVYQVFSRVTGGLVYRDEVTDGETTDYVAVGGAALRLKKTSTLTPEYTHFDHQGSALAATNASGAVLWRERYSPWGTRLLKPAGNKGDTGYTGHLMDAATELVYMQARYYDSQIGRFYSTDPVGYEDQLNLYAYVHNDPVNQWDPDGRDAACFYVGGCQTNSTDFTRGVDARFASLGATGRYLFDAARGAPAAKFVNSIDDALTAAVVRNPGTALKLAADQYLDNGFAYNAGNAAAGAALGAPFATGSGIGVGLAVLGANTAQNISGSGMRSIYSAYDSLTEAGVSPDALGSKALGQIAVGVANNANFSYDAKSNTLTGSYSRTEIGSRIPVPVKIEIKLDEDR